MRYQTKIYLIVIPIVAMVSLVHGLNHRYLLHKELTEEQESMENELHEIYDHNLNRMLKEHYVYELRRLLLVDGILEAINEGDRERLQRLVQPYWEIEKRENRHVKRLHFHRADGTSLLRVHKPESHGDNVAKTRPFVRDLHKHQVQMQGVDAGKDGVYFRIGVPVHLGMVYLGAVEIGLDIAYLQETFSELLGVESYLFLHEKDLRLVEGATPHGVLFNGYRYLADGDERPGLLKFLPPTFDVVNNIKIRPEPRIEFLAHVMELPAPEDGADARLVVFQDTSFFPHESRQDVLASLADTATVLLIVILILRFTLNPLAKNLERIDVNLMRKTEEVTRLKVTDPLTRTYNRSKALETIKLEVQRAQQNMFGLGLLLFNMDDLNRINGIHGLKTGDRILREVSRLTERHIGVSDTFARWSGDEFMIILPLDSMQQAQTFAGKLCREVENHVFSDKIKVTISVGVTLLGVEDTVESLLRRADENLREAKQHGKNCAVAA